MLDTVTATTLIIFFIFYENFGSNYYEEMYACMPAFTDCYEAGLAVDKYKNGDCYTRPPILQTGVCSLLPPRRKNKRNKKEEDEEQTHQYSKRNPSKLSHT